VAIAEKVPRPTPAEYKDIARDCAQSVGWKWITDKQRAALQDEAEQWQGNADDFADKINTAWRGGPSKHAVTCSFCGKSQDQVHTMFTGTDAAICDECVERASAAITERKAKP
jgi:hypothetical protein